MPNKIPVILENIHVHVAVIPRRRSDISRSLPLCLSFSLSRVCVCLGHQIVSQIWLGWHYLVVRLNFSTAFCIFSSLVAMFLKLSMFSSKISDFRVIMLGFLCNSGQVSRTCC